MERLNNQKELHKTELKEQLKKQKDELVREFSSINRENINKIKEEEKKNKKLNSSNEKLQETINKLQDANNEQARLLRNSKARDRRRMKKQQKVNESPGIHTDLSQENQTRTVNAIDQQQHQHHQYPIQTGQSRVLQTTHTEPLVGIFNSQHHHQQQQNRYQFIVYTDAAIPQQQQHNRHFNPFRPPLRDVTNSQHQQNDQNSPVVSNKRRRIG
ncbi:unnamed protein product [Ambrosiozyma monospora]|uniref:Unnamed protein product n=1 Tax=Ambrosiozyma monospora TaxID=43982 RepID=A0ACB5SS76_AMBMO|nr:unnamed protein product [Ambrosiozyma monospora]